MESVLSWSRAIILLLPTFTPLPVLQAGVQLKKVQPEAQHPAPAGDGGRFVPNPADLLKLKAGLRKTNAGAAEEGPAAQPAEQQAHEQAEAKAAPPCGTAAEAAPAADSSAPLERAADKPEVQPVAEPGKAGDPDPAPVAEERAAEHEAQVPLPAVQAVCEEPVDVAMVEAQPEPAAAAQTPAPGAAPEQELAAEQPTDVADVVRENAALAEAGQERSVTAVPVAPAAVPCSAHRKRVRFVEGAASTPEGAARDATITIRLRRGDLEQARTGKGGCLGWPACLGQTHHGQQIAGGNHIEQNGCKPPGLPPPAPVPCLFWACLQLSEF